MVDANERPTRPPFQSMLSQGPQRFLAHVVEHSLSCGRRSPEDFIRHFTPRTIMQGLEHEPALRASIIVHATGLKEKIALKKEWEDATVDLQIALDEGETDAATVVALFSPDDRIRFLDAQQIWGFIVEGDFWKSSSASRADGDVARSHIAFMLDRALEDRLITHRDIVEGVTVEELATRLPKAELGRLIMQALQSGERGGSFTEADLIATTPPRTLVQYVPLAHVWDSVIVPRIAERHGYVQAASAPELASATQPDQATTPHAPLLSVSAEASKPAAESSFRRADANTKNGGVKETGAKDAGANAKDATNKDAANAANKDAASKDAAAKDSAPKDAPAPSPSGVHVAPKLTKEASANKRVQAELGALSTKPANDLFTDGEDVVLIEDDLKTG